MDGNTVETIYWGDTPEEVYEKCKSIIDPLYEAGGYEEMGYDRARMFTKSVTFTRARLEDNKKLTESDPNYVANLAQQDEEQRARDLEGNWNFKNVGDDIIKMHDMEQFSPCRNLPEGNVMPHATWHLKEETASCYGFGVDGIYRMCSFAVTIAKVPFRP